MTVDDLKLFLSLNVKNTKKNFRRICRFAFSKKQNRQYKVIDALWKCERTGEC